MVDELTSLLCCCVYPDMVGEEFQLRLLQGSGVWLTLLSVVFDNLT